ncbi:MAG: hypothetical protein ABSF77_11385 [Spirochaetia bacterium]|jgi:hypothetical protein
MIFAAIASLSASSLAFELLITRYFSIAHWSHLSFLAIGVAMFGFAAGGTFHCMAGGMIEKAARRAERSLFSLLCVAGSIATIGAFLLVKSIPLDYLRFPVDPTQALFLLLTWLILSLPFFISGLVSCTAYALRPDRSGTISFTSLLGASGGVLAPLLLLPIVGEGGAIAVSAAVPLLPVMILPGTLFGRIPASLLAAGLAAAVVWSAEGMLEITPSAYKTLAQLEQAPGTIVSSRATDIRGRLEEVKSPALHFAPGLSLGFTGSLPGQWALIQDGDALTVLYDLSSPGSEEFARWTHPYAAYAIAQRPENSLVIQQDGGLALACAMASRTPKVTLVVEDPRIAARAARQYGLAPGQVFSAPPRTFMARTSDTFDVIAVEEWGPTIPGMASLQEDALFTRDAMQQYWRHLAENGVLAISRRMVLPPSDSLRLFAACLSGLAREGESDPSLHLAVIRSWDSCTLLASRQAFDGMRLARLRGFALSRGFDLDYFPGIPRGAAGRFNLYQSPVFTDAYLSIVRDPGFTSRYPLDIGPQDDNRPFPSHFIRWTRIGEFFRTTGQRAYSLFLSGEVVAAVTLAAACVASLLLIVPVLLPARGRRAKAGSGAGAFLLLAAAAGLGFMFAEMFVVDSITLLFPAPSIALAIALGGLLVSSAFGGLVSERLDLRSFRVILPFAAAALAAGAFLLPLAARWALSLALGPRTAVCLCIAGAPGFLIGIPFPAALRILGSGARLRASAWALNGCASAAASISAALIAPAAGIRVLLLLGAAGYMIASAAAMRPGARLQRAR